MASIVCEMLSIETCFAKQGFEIQIVLPTFCVAIPARLTAFLQEDQVSTPSPIGPPAGSLPRHLPLEFYDPRCRNENGSNRTIMMQIQCSGTPYEIGLEHGKAAKIEVCRSLKFYADLFLKSAGLSWSEVCDTAVKFDEMLQEGWPVYWEEMRGEPVNRLPETLCSLFCISSRFMNHINVCS